MTSMMTMISTTIKENYTNKNGDDDDKIDDVSRYSFNYVQWTVRHSAKKCDCIFDIDEDKKCVDDDEENLKNYDDLQRQRV